MSSGQTEGKDLVVETLQFIVDNWQASAEEFDRAIVDSSTDPVTVWEKPVLRDGREKTIYHPNDGDVAGYSYALRNNDVVTVDGPGRTDEPMGSSFDFDVEAGVDVRCEAMLNGQTVIDDGTDWKVFIDIVRRAILRERSYPLINTNSPYSWWWLTVTNQSTLPETEDNRDHYGTELTVSWFGKEELP